MKWQRIPLGPIQTNAYLYYDDKGECLIIDPGSEGNKLSNIIKEKKLKPLAILLTHAHFDHIGAADKVRERFGIPVYVHKEEKDWLTSPELNGSSKMGMEPITANPAEHLIDSEKELEIGPFKLAVLHTPGHSPGSVSYYDALSDLVFSGDALFAGSIGRTDLTGGNHELLLKSIHNKLLSLPEETLVLSGHGPETSIEAEMDSNPFLNGF
ncbi:MBL fold metallo-hydrolase [Metabacillus sp. GX 13764]|uniref:MBL fold metallo-hydrolase n=1 Tax=Metabacillus kandeliae TaxID=2900151 RepID=UPI001E4095BC|nr:MBL fold metallo-hydrolase [Metabacillus kandeliae]MCD7033119.1 MBL fold metallo-hydrolase [Metabacillus kandeliae]